MHSSASAQTSDKLFLLPEFEFSFSFSLDDEDDHNCVYVYLVVRCRYSCGKYWIICGGWLNPTSCAVLVERLFIDCDKAGANVKATVLTERIDVKNKMHNSLMHRLHGLERFITPSVLWLYWDWWCFKPRELFFLCFVRLGLSEICGRVPPCH